MITLKDAFESLTQVYLDMVDKEIKSSEEDKLANENNNNTENKEKELEK